MNFDNTEIAFAPKSTRDLNKAHFLFSSMAKPWLTSLGIQCTYLAFKLHLPIKNIIKKTIFNQFCGGETLDEASISAQKIFQYGVGVILDYGVEGKKTEPEFDATTAEFIRTIQFAKNKKHIPFISIKVTGFARFELLEQLDAKHDLSESELDEWNRVRRRLDDICKNAIDCGLKILIDAEESWIQGPVDELALDMMRKYNQKSCSIFNTYQMYRHDRLAFLKKEIELASTENFILGSKLVRGAYMEKERARAIDKKYPSPIQATKEATDRDYDEAVLYCLEHIDCNHLFVGTHNELSCYKAIEYMGNNKISKAHVYFSQLFGMSDNISFNLAKEEYQVSKYLPYGPVHDVIPYLMRRAQENTSVAGQTGRELTLINKEILRRKK